MSFEKKYLHYKKKYLKLKILMGGRSFVDVMLYINNNLYNTTMCIDDHVNYIMNVDLNNIMNNDKPLSNNQKNKKFRDLIILLIYNNFIRPESDSITFEKIINVHHVLNKVRINLIISKGILLTSLIVKLIQSGYSSDELVSFTAKIRNGLDSYYID